MLHRPAGSVSIEGRRPLAEIPARSISRAASRARVHGYDKVKGSKANQTTRYCGRARKNAERNVEVNRADILADLNLRTNVCMYTSTYDPELVHLISKTRN